MSVKGFDFRMAKWMPFQDQQECRRVAAIKREDIAKHPNPDFKIKVLDDEEFPFRLVTDIFLRIKKAGEEGRRLVLILPQPETLYSRVAFLLNQCRVNCAHLYTFNMDEYADEQGNIAPESWPNSFLYNMKKNFYAKLEAEFEASGKADPRSHERQLPGLWEDDRGSGRGGRLLRGDWLVGPHCVHRAGVRSLCGGKPGRMEEAGTAHRETDSLQHSSELLWDRNLGKAETGRRCRRKGRRSGRRRSWAPS